MITFLITYRYHLVSPSRHTTVALLGSILFANRRRLQHIIMVNNETLISAQIWPYLLNLFLKFLLNGCVIFPCNHVILWDLFMHYDPLAVKQNDVRFDFQFGPSGFFRCRLSGTNHTRRALSLWKMQEFLFIFIYTVWNTNFYWGMNITYF